MTSQLAKNNNFSHEWRKSATINQRVGKSNGIVLIPLKLIAFSRTGAGKCPPVPKAGNIWGEIAYELWLSGHTGKQTLIEHEFWRGSAANLAILVFYFRIRVFF